LYAEPEVKGVTKEKFTIPALTKITSELEVLNKVIESPVLQDAAPQTKPVIVPPTVNEVAAVVVFIGLAVNRLRINFASEELVELAPSPVEFTIRSNEPKEFPAVSLTLTLKFPELPAKEKFPFVSVDDEEAFSIRVRDLVCDEIIVKIESVAFANGLELRSVNLPDMIVVAVPEGLVKVSPPPKARSANRLELSSTSAGEIKF